MIERGQVFVRAIDRDGKWDSVDALDLDDESFRRFVLEHLARRGQLVVLNNKAEDDEPEPLRERK